MSSQGVMYSKETNNNPGFVLIKDNNLALVDSLGPKINSQDWLCELQGPHHYTKCWLSIQHFILLLMFYLETPNKSSGPTNLWTDLSLASLSAITLPSTLTRPGTQNSPIVCQAQTPLNIFRCCRTNWDVVLAAWSAFRVAWLYSKY
jgi:hypothetical protein